MKLNGISNVITDVDITLTSNKHIGESLQTVLEDTDNRIDKLESNVKWIYQNGGVGSGSGGGGGSSKWYLRATLGGISIDSNQQVPLKDGAGNYQLRLYTSGGSGTYSVAYTYGNTPTNKVILSADNGWSATVTITLVENGILEIIATDGSITREITGVSYIVIPYVFNPPELYHRDGTPYTSASNDIFVETAQQNGIVIKASYIIASEGEFWYTRYFNGIQQDPEPISIHDTTGVISYEVDPSLFVNENAGLYSYQLVITVLDPGSTEPYDISQSCSFSLIPDTLYLKISPANSDEIIYDDPSIVDPFVFSTNTSIALNARIYNGLTASGLSGTIWWVINGDPDYSGNGRISVVDGTTYTISTYFANAGWNYVTFYYNLDTQAGTPITKYFYCEEVNTSYDWFFKTQSSENTPDTRRYYIAQALGSENKLYGITGVESSALYIEKKKSDDNPTVLNVVSNVDGKTYIRGDQMFNFGIQYNDINDVNLPLITCYDASNNEAIKIYQNKVIFSGQFSISEVECNIFLHKEDQYDVSDRTKYNLLTINCATCYYYDNKSYYELSVYLNGKLEGTVKTKVSASATITSIALQNVNFAINHFEISSWGSISSRRVFDIDINWYYNSYASRLGKTISDTDTLILTSLFNTSDIIAKPDYSIENQLVKVNVGLPATIASNTTVPVLTLTCPRDIIYNHDIHTIYEWMNNPWMDGEDDLNRATFNISKLEWSPGGEGSILSEIHNPKESDGTEEHELGEFILDLQGSSTMTYKSKNFTLGIRPTEYVTSQNKQTLFSPNFNENLSNTYLPETSFTLKADVVDSSHTNNTAVGKFVNENNNWDYRSMINLSGVQENIRSHVKQCLEGFATLLFLNVTWKDESQIDHVDCYYLGIYNFNLGRGSYFNLGYSDLTQLDAFALSTSAQSNHGFAFCTANTTPVIGFVAAEVQDNSPYWDFSQYDDSILFPLPNSGETSGYMFGDLVYAPNTEGVESCIKSFVKSVAGGGGFLFDLIGKRKLPASSVGEDNKQQAYHKYDVEIDPETGRQKVYTYVNDYSKQYTRRREGSDIYYDEYQGDLQNLTSAYLEDCIIGDVSQGKNPHLDYESIVYYYTTCMVLGLVDSVQKNLNIKTWNASNPYPKVGAFFYDMDTCLGKSNSGTKTSYFAFSDYWKSNIERYDSSGHLIPDDDTTTPVARTVNKGITNFRDTFLWGSNVSGYDTPSSYLFAIAKYAYLMDFTKESFQEIFPQNIYARWRTQNGVLKSADNFINNYFASNLNGISECLINLNYRNKYLYDYQEQGNFAMSQILHGTGVEETRDWLKGRLRILDAYFNVISATIQINDLYYEPTPIATTSTNPDVNLYKDIFTNNTTTYISRKESMSFNVTAPDYSPLVVRQGNNYIWYLFEDSNTEYETYVPISGVQITVFGGSQMWRTLNSINAFVESRDSTSSNFIFNTDTLTSMIGNSGTQTGRWDVYGPSLETINLTSSNYAGELNIDRNFYSIKNVNISNSRISFKASDSCPVKNVTANNLRNASTFTLLDCNQLENVYLNNSTIGTCEIRPTWTDNLNFSNIYASVLKLEAKNSGNLTINDNSVINTLSFSKMQNVNINNCSALTTVTCIDTENAPLKNVTITNCPSLTKITLKADNLEVLNLSNCTTLEEIVLNGASFDNLRILGLGNTKVSKITIGNTVCTNGVFDFRQFTKLAKVDPNYSGTPYVSFYNNKQLVSIQFDNSGDTILRYDPNRYDQVSNVGPFRECDNLERLYGSFLIEASYCFYKSYKFSVHGDNLQNVTWYGQSVLSGERYRHPSEWGVSSSADYWPRTNGITNMKFNGDYAEGCFYLTNYTIFDVYYMLYGCDNRVKSLINTFREGRNTTWCKFNWNNSVDNSPNVNMFANCGGVTSISHIFYGNSGTIRLFSPSHSGENVTQNNGLFSPLTSVKDITRAFYNYTVYGDRFVLRRVSDSYKITTMNDFRMTYIVNDVNNYVYVPTPSINTNDYGNLTNFFKNLTNLSGNVYGLLWNTILINFTTLASVSCKIPDNIISLIACFRSTYGLGNISLSAYFSTNTKLQNIHHSFITTSKLNDVYPTMTLSNNTFERFVPRSGYTGLLEVGYSNSNTNYPTAGPLGSSFSGVIYKDFGATFPYDIFKNLTNLKMAAGVFMNAYGSATNLQLPGRLFEKNTLLENCAAEFYDLHNDYSISDSYEITYNLSGNAPVAVISKATGSPNFIYCTNINDVSYMFGGTPGDTIPSLSGQIPRNLFWHGLNSSATRKVAITGTDIRTPIIDPETGEPTGEYEYGTPETVYQYIISPNATISHMEYCFQHCNCNAYVEENLPYEPNPNYSPFNYLTDDGGETFYDNPKKDARSLTSEWFYDGRTNYTTISNNSDVVLLDTINWDETYSGGSLVYTANTSDWLESNPGQYQDVKPQVKETYICAPDLLRYCTSSVGVDYLFGYSGEIGMNTYHYVSSDLWLIGGKYAFGILGRICPYLLKPIPNIESVNGMFISCKRLTYISDNYSNSDYLIPDNFFTYAKKINSLQKMFMWTIQPPKVNMIDCFTCLGRNNLDVSYMFANCYWQGTNVNNAVIRNVFSNNNIDSLIGVFEMEGSSTQNAYPKNQYITFSDVFNRKYASNTYASNVKFSYAFYGWTEGYVTHEVNKTLPDNTDTNNYTYVNN